jgi:inhibitor of KinA sporulation pathway (predicted exonuclease)
MSKYGLKHMVFVCIRMTLASLWQQMGTMTIMLNHRPTYFPVACIDIRRPWDCAKFLRMQCYYNDIEYPRWARKWINIRKEFSNFYSTRPCGKIRSYLYVFIIRCCSGIIKMLAHVGLTFEGRHHSGLVDATNIARVAIELLQVCSQLTMK